MKRILCLDGDGVGPEVMDVAVRAIEALQAVPEAGLQVQVDRPLMGERAVAQGLDPCPPEVLDACRHADAVLFGATGTHSGLVLAHLRWGLGTFVNVRPVRWIPGAQSPLRSPDGVAMTILRENLEDMYPSREGDLQQFAERWPEFRDIFGRSAASYGPGLFALRVFSEAGMQRFAAFARDFVTKQAAASRRRLQVAVVTKSNVLIQTCGRFRAVVEAALSAVPNVDLHHWYVDDAARRLVAMPEQIDVVVTSNLFGDILSDLAAEITGGMGLAPSACFGERHAYFEPVHGSAPDIAGTGIVNPTAMLLSLAMALEHLGFEPAAALLREAIDGVYAEGMCLTPDQGGTARCDAFGDAVIRRFTEPHLTVVGISPREHAADPA